MQETEGRLPAFSFDTNPKVVEQQIKGAIFVVGDKRFMIVDAEGFEGEKITRKEFLDAKQQPIGTITGSPYRGILTFPNISVQEGLVMPRVVNELTPEGSIKRIEGPDRVARALGITQHGHYRLDITDPYSKVIHLQQVSEETS